MKRPTKGYSGQEVALFPTMLNIHEPLTSPSRITSSTSPSFEPSPKPSTKHSPEHTSTAETLSSPTQPSLGVGQHIPTPYNSPFHAVHSHGTVTKLILRVKKLETKARLGMQGKELGLCFLEMMKMLKMILPNRGGNSLMQSTAEANFSTARRIVTYQRSSEEKRTRKDKGKAIMTEPEPKKKSKKELEQERLKIARQWEEQERQAMSKAKKIDWNDPLVIRYHALKMKPKTVAQARRNMIKYLKN
ncbi:hypothetical protein Tco_1421717 [Tanacetum coccineum]